MKPSSFLAVALNGKLIVTVSDASPEFEETPHDPEIPEAGVHQRRVYYLMKSQSPTFPPYFTRPSAHLLVLHPNNFAALKPTFDEEGLQFENGKPIKKKDSSNG
jgi:hypothetical protein